MNEVTFYTLILIAGLLIASSSEMIAQTPPTITPEMKAQQDNIDAKLQIPFDFYGKVIDRSGRPISGATANVFAMGEVGKVEGKTKHVVESDDSGMFSLKGIRAFGIIVTVSKKGYQALPDSHIGGYQPGKDMPDATNPAVFTLQKRSAVTRSIMLKGRSVPFTDDGKPVTISLSEPHAPNEKADSLTVQAWIDKHDPKSNLPFYWKFRISIPEGGLLPIVNDYDLAAPASGYKPSDEIEMAPNDPKWNDNFERKFFVKWSNGHYGRIKFFITPSGDHFFRVEGVLNPTGSQDLE